jgi:hypothetical protein
MTVRDLEDRSLWIVRLSVRLSALALAGGLLLRLLASQESRSRLVIGAGLMVLMLTPVLRILIAVAERLRRRDLQLVAITAVVLLELSLTLWYATTRV